MAGTRHHIIPQFLLRGFASRRTGKRVSAWFYRRNCQPIETNIRNIAVSRHFYGKDDTSTDDTITELESTFAVLVNALRKSRGLIRAPDLPALIVHLSSRTKGLRDNFSTNLDSMTGKLQRYMKRPKNLRAVLIPEIRDAVSEIMNQLSIPRAQQPMTRAILEQYVHKQIELNTGSFANDIQTLFHSFRKELPNITTQAHNRALLRRLTDETDRIRNYKKFRWCVETTNVPLILSDAMCIFQCTDGRFRILDDVKHLATRIYLPIATNRVVVGTRGTNQQTNFNDLNRASAKCSRDYFVASNNNGDHVALMPLMGTDSNLLDEEEVGNIVGEVIESLKR